jgi:hypothetical protein
MYLYSIDLLDLETMRVTNLLQEGADGQQRAVVVIESSW